LAVIDFLASQKVFYNPKFGQFSLVEIPEMTFITVDGSGNPNVSLEFTDAVASLYSVAYTLKFALKVPPRSLEFKVAPLEGLWWMEDMTQFSVAVKDQWLWKLMIHLPDELTEADLADALGILRKKKKSPPAAERLQLERISEGLCLQTMYFGSYSDEGPTIAALHQHAAEHGYKLRGKHHEIYLGDPRKSAPEKLKTVIRQGVE